MDKKIYTIEINGIEANIRKIDDLNQRLQVLDTRLRDLPADININLPKMDASVSSSISTAVGGTSQTAELRQQQQALEGIARTKQTINDLDKNAYLLLQQEKAAIKEQKALLDAQAAAQRLAAKEYSDNIRGWKQELKDLKTVMQFQNVNDSGFEALTTRARQLNEALLQVEKSYGQFGRNVGNYPGGFQASQEVGILEQEINKLRQSLTANYNDEALDELLTDLTNLEQEVQSIGDSLYNNINDLISEAIGEGVPTEAFDKLKEKIEMKDLDFSSYEELRRELTEIAGFDISTERPNLATKFEIDIQALENARQQVRDLQEELDHLNTGKNALKVEIQAKTDQLREAQERLKSLQQQLGQVKKDVSKPITIKFTIDGNVREFDNLREAYKQLKQEAGAMAFNGLTDTKAYQDTIDALKQIKSALGDIERSSAGMDHLLDTMEGLVGAVNAGRGIMTAFGFDDDEINKSIQRLLSLQTALKGIETINKQMTTGEGIGKYFQWILGPIDKATDAITNFILKKKEASATQMVTEDIDSVKESMENLTEAVNETSTAVKGVGKSATLAAKGVKLLGAAIKAIGFMALISIITALVDKIMDAVSSIGKLTDAQKRVAEVTEEGNQAYGKAIVDIKNLQQRLQSFNGTKKQEERMIDEVNAQYGKMLGTYKTKDEWLKKLQKSTESYIKAMVLEAETAKLVSQIVELEQKKREYLNPSEQTLDEEKSWYEFGYDKAIKRLKEKAAEVEKELGSLNKQLEGKINEQQKLLKDNALGVYSPQVDKKAEKNAEKYADMIRDTQEEINKIVADLMEDGLRKQLRQLDNERTERLNKIKGNSQQEQRLRQLIIAQYDRKEKELVGNHYKEMIRILTDYEEQIATIRESTARTAIGNFGKNTGLKKNEQLKELMPEVAGGNYSAITRDMSDELQLQNNIYEDALDKRLSIYREYEARRLAIERAAAERGDYIETEALELDTKAIKEAVETYSGYMGTLIGISQTATTQINAMLASATTMADKNPESQAAQWTKEFIKDQQEMLKVTKTTVTEMVEQYDELTSATELKEMERNFATYVATRKKLLEDSEKEVAEISRIEEEKRTTEQKQQLIDLRTTITDIQSELGGSLYADYEQGKITFKDFLDTMKHLQEEYSNNILALQNKSITDRKAIEEKAYKDIEENLRNSFKRQENIYRTESDRIGNMMDSISRRKNDWNIIPIGDNIKDLSQLRKSVERTIKDIEVEMRRIQQNRDMGIISEDTYRDAMDRLSNIKEQYSQQLQDIDDQTKQQLSTFMQGINTYIQAGLNAMSQLMQSIADYEDSAYQKRIERLDKFIEQYEQRLQEQQDITETYKDKAKTTEEELSDARGDRRQYLIDQLNAEIAAQRRSLKEEQKMQKEKLRLEQQKEEEEKKQRRREQQRALISAQISTASAVANGLATPPFVPVGIAMGALASALGTAQIALIASQQYLEKGGQLEGGVIQGRRHSQGGVKVLGGRATVEGGEFITNRVSTSKNVEVLEYINSKHKKLTISDFVDFFKSKGSTTVVKSVRNSFALGGELPVYNENITVSDRLVGTLEKYADRPSYVSVVEIDDVREGMKRVEAAAGLS